MWNSRLWRKAKPRKRRRCHHCTPAPTKSCSISYLNLVSHLKNSKGSSWRYTPSWLAGTLLWPRTTQTSASSRVSSIVCYSYDLAGNVGIMSTSNKPFYVVPLLFKLKKNCNIYQSHLSFLATWMVLDAWCKKCTGESLHFTCFLLESDGLKYLTSTEQWRTQVYFTFHHEFSLDSLSL